MHHPPWRAGLEDRALGISVLGEMRSCHSRMERKDLCAAHTSVTSGSSAPLPGNAADGNAVAGVVRPELPGLTCPPRCLPAVLPFHPCSALL